MALLRWHFLKLSLIGTGQGKCANIQRGFYFPLVSLIRRGGKICVIRAVIDTTRVGDRRAAV